MARPHTEFIQAQVLPWKRGLYGGTRLDVEVKTLSIDKDNGDSSLVLRYPGGWASEAPERLAADEEIFVLDGELEINGTAYRKNCYAYLPAGFARESATSESGAVALSFFSGTPSRLPPESKEGFDESLLVAFVDTVAQEWEVGGFDPNLRHMKAGRKSLWTHPRTKETTFLFCTTPHCVPDGWKGPQETHDVVEESFVISGEIAGHVGLRRPGAYYWRPPGIRHGPFGSLTGSVALFRIRGGPLVNEWSEDEVQFTFSPAYTPSLPPEIAELGTEEWRGSEPY
jgi:hypothetical protein